MTLMHWDRHYGSGIEQLDTEHRIISELIVQLDDAVDTGQGRDIVTNIFSVLDEFIRFHRQREEAILTRQDIPPDLSPHDIAKHLQDHDALLEGLLYISQHWDAGGRDIQDFIHTLRARFEESFVDADRPSTSSTSAIATTADRSNRRHRDKS